LGYGVGLGAKLETPFFPRGGVARAGGYVRDRLHGHYRTVLIEHGSDDLGLSAATARIVRHRAREIAEVGLLTCRTVLYAAADTPRDLEAGGVSAVAADTIDQALAAEYVERHTRENEATDDVQDGLYDGISSGRSGFYDGISCGRSGWAPANMGATWACTIGSSLGQRVHG
jgi:hypothetical protein